MAKGLQCFLSFTRSEQLCFNYHSSKQNLIHISHSYSRQYCLRVTAEKSGQLIISPVDIQEKPSLQTFWLLKTSNTARETSKLVIMGRKRGERAAVSSSLWWLFKYRLFKTNKQNYLFCFTIMASYFKYELFMQCEKMSPLGVRFLIISRNLC